MQVIGSCGVPLGRVDRLEGRLIKLSKPDEEYPHFVPLAWVERIDDAVHLDPDNGSRRR
jgi:hypothetical protein